MKRLIHLISQMISRKSTQIPVAVDGALPSLENALQIAERQKYLKEMRAVALRRHGKPFRCDESGPRVGEVARGARELHRPAAGKQLGNGLTPDAQPK
jgi:hypothetical protein